MSDGISGSRRSDGDSDSGARGPASPGSPRARPDNLLHERRTRVGTIVLITVAALIVIAAGTTLVIGLGELGH